MLSAAIPGLPMQCVPDDLSQEALQPEREADHSRLYTCGVCFNSFVG
jgi:hypothetical protein